MHTKQPSYGKVGSSKAELCADHAKGSMVNVVNKRCSHSRCTKRPSHGTVGSNTPEVCVEHAKDDMVVARGVATEGAPSPRGMVLLGAV